ncbi:MAG: hypothetical protein BV456_00740 [Thermoplasmata archaeon M8B2D]|nr:MAG: hypothetical protein BV456_00740 [Thermoplasmata archaeon M8B2D]
MPQYIKYSPEYILHRSGITAADSTFTSYDHGVNTSYYKKANIQVVPSGGANPTVNVMWWCESASKFINEHVAIEKAGIGANTPFEFTVDCLRRTMFVAVSAISTGSVDILVSGADLAHPE